MTIWILAFLFLAALAGLGYRQGAIRVAFSLVGILFGALLAFPLARLVKPLVAATGLKGPVLLWLLPPLVVFAVVLTIFKIGGLVTHQKAEVFFKYHSGELRLALWERLNRRVGLCLALVNGTAYFLLIIMMIYPLAYWSYQMASPDSDPKLLRLLNQVGADLQSTGMTKVARALDKNPDVFYQTADLVGLIYHHPLLEARLSRYPAFLGLAEERPEFQDLAKDSDFAQMRLKQPQASLIDLMDYPKISAMLVNPDLMARIETAVTNNLSDLQNFLTTGVSQKYTEEILGRWDYDLHGSMLQLRKSKPNISSNEMQKWKQWMSSLFAKVLLIATTEHGVFLKNMPKLTGGQPGELQSLQGKWNGAGGSYNLSINADGKNQEATANVQGDRMTVSGMGTEMVFAREN